MMVDGEPHSKRTLMEIAEVERCKDCRMFPAEPDVGPCSHNLPFFPRF